MHLDCGLCVVRDWHSGDKDSLMRAANDRSVWRNLAHRFPHPYTEAHADFWLAQAGKAAAPTRWAIEVEGEASGGIGFEPGEGIHAKSAHFGYWLGRRCWGREG